MRLRETPAWPSAAREFFCAVVGEVVTRDVVAGVFPALALWAS